MTCSGAVADINLECLLQPVLLPRHSGFQKMLVQLERTHDEDKESATDDQGSHISHAFFSLPVKERVSLIVVNYVGSY